MTGQFLRHSWRVVIRRTVLGKDKIFKISERETTTSLDGTPTIWGIWKTMYGVLVKIFIQIPASLSPYRYSSRFDAWMPPQMVCVLMPSPYAGPSMRLKIKKLCWTSRKVLVKFNSYKGEIPLKIPSRMLTREFHIQKCLSGFLVFVTCNDTVDYN